MANLFKIIFTLLLLLINKIIYAGTLEDYYSCSVDAYVAKVLQIDNAIKKHKNIQTGKK